MNKNIITFIIFILLIPISYSNGGCIKIADDVFVQLTSSPLVPIAGKEASFLVSFGNNQGLINKDIVGNIRIMKDDEIILKKDFKAENGILSIKHKFNNPGLYEIFLDFKIGNKSYAPEDFLIEVKEKEQNLVFDIVILIIGILIGAILMKSIKIK